MSERKEIKRTKNVLEREEFGSDAGYDAIHVVCDCGEKFDLWYNGGELDRKNCKCGRYYQLEHPQPPDLVVYK